MGFKSSDTHTISEYFKNNALTILGIIFIIIAILILFNNTIANLIRPITELFLMGSSKGKDLLFFTGIGFLLIISSSKYFNSQPFWKLATYSDYSKSIQNKKSQKYLKITLILLIISLLIALATELIMRANLSIAPLTTFVVVIPETTTTSILHTHIFKSVASNFSSDIINLINNIVNFNGSATINAVPSIATNINTGNSLYYYIPKIANIFLVLYPIIGIFGIFSLKNRTVPSKLVLIFTMVCGLIGLLDGGLFAVPTIIGLFGLIYIYCSDYWFNYYLLYLVNYIKNNIHNNNRNNESSKYRKEYLVKRIPEKIKKGITYSRVKRTIPLVFLILIIILRVFIGIMGTNVDYYEVTILEPIDELNLSNSLKVNLNNTEQMNNINKFDNKTVITVTSNETEIQLIDKLVYIIKDYNNPYKSISINKVINNSTNNTNNNNISNDNIDNINNSKINAFALSWNFYSYL
ncbi:MAG: hypothetical protein ACRC1M_07805 [Methanobacteriaceae archaeon]